MRTTTRAAVPVCDPAAVDARDDAARARRRAVRRRRRRRRSCGWDG